MPKARLYVPSPLASNRPVELDADRTHYLGRVLRLRTGAELTVFDGSGSEYHAVVGRLRDNRATLEVGEADSRDAESPLAVTLVQGVARGDRMDFVVQKATELGVRAVQPVLTDHAVVRLAGERAERRAEHWRRIAVSACEQCGRNRVPQIGPPMRLVDFLARESDAVLRIALAPDAAQRLSAGERPGSGVLEVLVGPEGGLSADEAEAAAAVGFRRYSLGPRILRAETAGMAALAVLQARWGDS